jgi:sugar/nucleoside kinase (ribokinase family)
MRKRPQRAEAMSFAADLEQRVGSTVCCKPGFLLEVAELTTIGLGDTFVGGFLTTISERVNTWT